jgi:putative copper export protein
LKQFAEWLSQTALSLTIQSHEWVIPTIQSIHILAICAFVGSVLMLDLRILEWAWRDQTLSETQARFGPWAWWALAVLLMTGVLMIIGEPPRQLLAISFWMKMALVVLTASIQMTQVRRPVKALAASTFLVWLGVIVLGRLIAYDYVWGSWSTWLKG